MVSVNTVISTTDSDEAPGAPDGPGPAAPTGADGTAERSLRLLGVVAARERPVSLAELAAALALPKPSVHRLCVRLAASGMLVRDVDARRWGVGPALRRLALDTLHHGTVGGLRHRVLSELVARIGQTCNFTTLDGGSVLYLDRVEAPSPWRLTVEIGAHVPLHCTASGKLFLATMEEARRERLLGSLELGAMTPHTLVDPAALRDALGRIRADGYAIEREEFVAGLAAVAVPVTDAVGEVRAAIAVHCPIAGTTADAALEALPELRTAALRMAALL